ncbi:MAG: tetratricopeptide repeat-containing sensor histidine kinase [Ferruginibacter sp.]
MYKALLYFFLSVFFLQAQAQTKQADSLLKVLDSETADSSKAKTYNDIAQLYLDNNSDKALDYLLKSLEAAKKTNKKLLQANNYYSIGYCYKQKGDFDKSLDNYLQSVRIYESLKDNRRLTNALMSIGNVYGQNNNLKKVNEYYDRAQALIEQSKDSFQLADLIAERGMIYDQQKIYDTALIYLLQGQAIAKKKGDTDYVIRSLSNIGLTYKHQHKTAEALHCFDSVLVIFKATNAPADEIAVVYNNIAATYSQDKAYLKARPFFDSSIHYSQAADVPLITMENYRNLSDMYGDMKNYEQQSIFLKKYYGIKDSLFTADNKNQLTQLEADYHIEQKNGVITKQQAEVEKQKTERNVFIMLAIAAAIVLIVVGYFYSRIKNKNNQLAEQNVKINTQKEELLTLNHVKDRLFSIISHDLRNPLVTLRSYLFLADNKSLDEEKKTAYKNQTMEAVTQTSDMLDNLLAWANMQIKETKASIKPIDIEDCVSNAVNTVQAQAQQKQITINQQIDISNALGDEHILDIALRNILTNAIKYSAPGKSIYISTKRKGEDILLSIKDEGVGMTAIQMEQIMASQNETTKGTSGEKGSGLGLFLVKELLEKANEQLLVESEKDKGSVFTIVLSAL